MDKKQHLYESKLYKIRFFIHRFGIKELIRKPFRVLFAPLIVRVKKPTHFFSCGKEYTTFIHRYNCTWANERSVEIPIIADVVQQEPRRILEVGNVLSHYFPRKWDVLDKFEKGEGILNEDLHNFRPNEKYDLIVSISTFEHIGYDDDSGDSAEKIRKSFENIKNNCLKTNGTIIISVPIGYNPYLDRLIDEDFFRFTRQRFIKRISRNNWKEVSKKEALKTKFGKPFPYANSVMIGEKRNKEVDV